ncbi:MAG: hypothetical protein CMF59_19785 [Leptospiraceae bacterium]|nr:hypothetical protein [Leptospiraceae bacterium]
MRQADWLLLIDSMVLRFLLVGAKHSTLDGKNAGLARSESLEFKRIPKLPPLLQCCRLFCFLI